MTNLLLVSLIQRYASRLKPGERMMNLLLVSLIQRYASRLKPGERIKITVEGDSRIFILSQEPAQQLLQFITDLGKGDPNVVIWSAADPTAEETKGVTSTLTLSF